ncbi:MAG: glycosyltransferase [Chitinophagia bacterium]|nr:glycosyltransferase [Chitinophagia bacterium]
MILIDGLYINKGGGAVLLQYLIDCIMERQDAGNFFFLLDPRFQIPQSLKSNYTVIPNSMKARLAFYKLHKHAYSSVFCFANTPPPIRLKAKVFTYMHNQKLLEAPHRKLEKKYFRLYLKYLVISLFKKNTDYFIVQTPHMVAEVKRINLIAPDNCLTYPFYNTQRYAKHNTPFDNRPADEFAFISTPSPQKNYPTLIDAWEYLHEKGIHPALHITIDNTAPDLLARIAALQAKGVRIHNYSYIAPEELYFKYRYLICPSIMESFGLPLIEAAESGMKVIAPELPYVHDVITPSLTFLNPYSKIDMARAVIDAMNTPLPFPKVVATNQVNALIDLIARG